MSVVRSHRLPLCCLSIAYTPHVEFLADRVPTSLCTVDSLRRCRDGAASVATSNCVQPAFTSSCCSHAIDHSVTACHFARRPISGAEHGFYPVLVGQSHDLLNARVHPSFHPSRCHSTQLAMSSMFVPDPVMSLAVAPSKSKKGGADTEAFGKVRDDVVDICRRVFVAQDTCVYAPQYAPYDIRNTPLAVLGICTTKSFRLWRALRKRTPPCEYTQMTKANRPLLAAWASSTSMCI